MGEVYNFPTQDTPERTDMLWERLEEAERTVEALRRALGLIGEERGVDDVLR